jgi:uncharacterized phiE125 gp8 family phage protein
MITMIQESKTPLFTLEEVKAHLRLDHSFEDEYLSTLIKSATAILETWTGRSFLEKTWLCLHRVCSDLHRQHIELSHPPLIKIRSIHHVYEHIRRPLKRFSVNHSQTIPVVECHSDATNVEVMYTAGYGASPGDVPEPLRLATLLLAGDLYEQRGDTTLENNKLMMQLVHSYKIIRVR